MRTLKKITEKTTGKKYLEETRRVQVGRRVSPSGEEEVSWRECRLLSRLPGFEAHFYRMLAGFDLGHVS